MQRTVSVRPTWRLSALMLACAGALSAPVRAVAADVPGGAEAQESAFDSRILRSRGLSTQIGEYFRQSARFRPGPTYIDLYVNESWRGRKNARFDDEGRLCFDAEFLAAAGLVVPAATGSAVPACYDYRSFSPRTLVQIDVGLNRVDLIVPASDLASTASAAGVTGGRAALLNYRLDTLRNRNGGNAEWRSTSSYSQLSTEVGFNLDDWIFRSRQIVSSYQPDTGPTVRNNSHVYGYVQKSFAESRSTFQAGQITTQGFLFGGVPISGAQWAPEQSLVTRRGTDGLDFSGIAQTQARVEVWQNGLLIHSTVVPPGPFTVPDVMPLRRAGVDLELRVIESDGRQSQYRVSGATALANSIVPQGLTVAAGRVRGYTDLASDKPTIATAEQGFMLARAVPASAGVAMADRYAAAAAGVDLLPMDKLRVHLLGDFARDGVRGRTGAQTTASAVLALPGQTNFSLTARNQSEGFLPLSQVGLSDFARFLDGQYRSQYIASLGGAQLLGGSVAVNAGIYRSFNQAQSSSMALSWGRSFGWGNVNVSYQHRKLPVLSYGNGYGYGQSANSARNLLYIALSIPLSAGHSLTAYTRSRGDAVSTGVGVSGAPNDFISYNLNADHASGDARAQVGGSVSVVPRYTSVSLGYNESSGASRTWLLSASGGVIASDGNLVFSPYEVTDTFGVASVGTLGGVRLNTPRGPVWTDAWGRAALPALPPYSEGRVEIAGDTLPRNVDVGNALQSLKAGRGAVARADFAVAVVRRVLLTVRLPDGSLLPGGTAISTSDGSFVTASDDEGNVFLPDVTGPLTAALRDGRTCTLRFDMPAGGGTGNHGNHGDDLYQSADALCVNESAGASAGASAAAAGKDMVKSAAISKPDASALIAPNSTAVIPPK